MSRGGVLAVLADTEDRVLAARVCASVADARAWLAGRAAALGVPESLRLWQEWSHRSGVSLELLPGRQKIAWGSRFERLSGEI